MKPIKRETAPGLKSPPAKVLVAMSGGVDSSVAAQLLVTQGYTCYGATMRLQSGSSPETKPGDSEKDPGAHNWQNEVVDAQRVAAHLGIPHYLYDFSECFRTQVILPFVQAYLQGTTPDPCVTCNRCLKFGKLLDAAKQLGCAYLATGHYARVEFDGQYYLLKKARDGTKDQSYFLYSLTQAQLAQVLFPLGNLTKNETRRLANTEGLVVADKPESQDICFVPDGDYARVVQARGGVVTPGNIVDLTGRVLGKHRGVIHYTVGQRRGLGISGLEPQYVIALRPTTNEVVVGPECALFKSELIAGEFNWVCGKPPSFPLKCLAKIRYRHEAQPATVTALSGQIRVVFVQPQRAITPGQAVVLYAGDVVLGGGLIQQ